MHHASRDGGAGFPHLSTKGGSAEVFFHQLAQPGGVFFDTIGYYLAQKLIEQALE
jgi:hypothetical protein